MDRTNSDRWRVNRALKAYSQAKTVTEREATAAEAKTEPMLPPVTKGVEPADLWWAGLFAIMCSAFALVWLVAAAIRWFVGN